jgi:hypothetical protein
MDIYRIIVGAVLILAGVGYAGIRILADGAGDPNQGFLGGFGPVLVGIGVAVVGTAIIIF